jgi:hypothetical protein
MFNSTVKKVRRDCRRGRPGRPAELVTLAELAAEGFGYGSPYVKSPRDAIGVLAVERAVVGQPADLSEQQVLGVLIGLGRQNVFHGVDLPLGRDLGTDLIY